MTSALALHEALDVALSPESVELVWMYAFPIVEFRIPAAPIVFGIWRFYSTVTVQHMPKHPWRLRVWPPRGAHVLAVMLVEKPNPCLPKQNGREQFVRSAGANHQLSTSLNRRLAKQVVFKEKGKSRVSLPFHAGDRSPTEFEFTNHIWCTVENQKTHFGSSSDFATHVLQIDIVTTDRASDGNSVADAPELDFAAAYV